MYTLLQQNLLVKVQFKGQASRACPLHVFLHFNETGLTKITLKRGGPFALWLPASCPQREEVMDWFKSYLEAKVIPFPLPLELDDSFQGKVLRYLMGIPFGQRASYNEVAVGIGCPGGARAVGNGCHRNPFPLVIPCHRVVKSDGSLGGYAYGLEMKQKLLDFEGYSSSPSGKSS